MKEPKPVQEVHEIRHKMYEETKHLSAKELVDRINRNAEEGAKRYGLKLKQADKAA